MTVAVVELTWRDLAGWRPRGLCYDTGDARFLADDDTVQRPPPDIQIMCARCPVAKQCLEYALETEEKDGEAGIWGGTVPYQRRQLKRERHRERCPACGAVDTVVPQGRGEICIACGVSWIV